jgi:hypothetical protein
MILAIVLMALSAGVIALPALAQTDASNDEKAKLAALADKLQNPIANLVSVPIQNRWDFGIGTANAMRYTANIQPVIPFELSQDWNLITRTIVPVIYAESPTAGGSDKSGLGDIQQSFFFAPRKKVNGWILGAGPVFSWPTASDNALGSGKFGAGPSVIAFHQAKGVTYGVLANHIWSYAGWGDENVSTTYLAPVIAYRTKTLTAFSLSMESTYDWQGQQWTTSVGPGVGQLIKIGKQPVNLILGGKYYAAAPSGGPEWGMSFQVTFPFQK